MKNEKVPQAWLRSQACCSETVETRKDRRNETRPPFGSEDCRENDIGSHERCSQAELMAMRQRKLCEKGTTDEEASRMPGQAQMKKIGKELVLSTSEALVKTTNNGGAALAGPPAAKASQRKRQQGAPMPKEPTSPRQPPVPDIPRNQMSPRYPTSHCDRLPSAGL
ncbi:hypothetical protein LTR95_007389 [Oleoguttula sp. CCFEE 5521]